MFQVQHKFLKTDVSAIKTLKNYLLAGVGGFLHIYNLHSQDLILKKEVFNSQKIYGIIPNSSGTKIIIYGGKNIAIVDTKNEKCTCLEIDYSKILTDWILDAKWLENETKIATVSMHNKVFIWTKSFVQQIECAEKCILYSACICFETFQELMVLSGTVFSEILVWKPFYKTKQDVSPVLKRLSQHKGVIFSIDFNLDLGFICSASDDRSAVLWKIMNKEDLRTLSPDNTNILQIYNKCQVYGHISRVFRCCILSESFVTAGEDSLLIIWNFQGEVVRKIDSHQGGAIWSLDYNKEHDIICSGGNDGGIITFKINPKVYHEILKLPSEVPKLEGILCSGNMVCLSEKAVLWYYHKALKKWEQICEHSDLKKYAIMQMSLCKKMVAVAGFNGEMYIYKEDLDRLQQIYCHTFKNKSRIFSLHWINCRTLLVCQSEGKLHLCALKDMNVYPLQTFILPPSKERWSTCACLFKDHIIVGDRKGNVHNFSIKQRKLINTCKKAHNYLGVTNLYSNDNIIISLGRDGCLKHYTLSNAYLKCVGANKTKYSWLVCLENNYLLSFSGENFVISDNQMQRTLFETPCGGGHRSWDYLNCSKSFTFSYIKHKCINSVEISLQEFAPKEMSQGYHVHEINSVKVIELAGRNILISGGEDTTLRISVLENNNLKLLQCLKVHLSSIRTLDLLKISKTATSTLQEYLLFSAGGRAQIICWHFAAEIDTSENITTMCMEKYSYYEPLSQEQGETRIMDLCIMEINKQILFAGCSDGCVKVFLVTEEMTLSYHTTLFSRLNSVTKLSNVTILDTKILMSMSTDGNIDFWNVTDILSKHSSNQLNMICSHKIHQSGINSCAIKILGNNCLLILTGGDDNAVTLSLFKLTKTETDVIITKTHTFKNIGIHCAQITGSFITDEFFITSSIDQRIAIFKWKVLGDEVYFEFVQKCETTIADPQGMECSLMGSFLNIYVYGNGIEHVIVKKLYD